MWEKTSVQLISQTNFGQEPNTTGVHLTGWVRLRGMVVIERKFRGRRSMYKPAESGVAYARPGCRGPEGRVAAGSRGGAGQLAAG